MCGYPPSPEYFIDTNPHRLYGPFDKGFEPPGLETNRAELIPEFIHDFRVRYCIFAGVVRQYKTFYFFLLAEPRLHPRVEKSTVKKSKNVSRCFKERLEIGEGTIADI